MRTFYKAAILPIITVLLLGKLFVTPAHAVDFIYATVAPSTGIGTVAADVDPSDVHNDGFPIKVKRHRRGVYEVFFGRILPQPGGYAANKIGNSSGLCNLGLENIKVLDDIPQTAMEVLCFKGDFTEDDSAFTILRMTAGNNVQNPVAYGVAIPQAPRDAPVDIFLSQPENLRSLPNTGSDATIAIPGNFTPVGSSRDSRSSAIITGFAEDGICLSNDTSLGPQFSYRCYQMTPEQSRALSVAYFVSLPFGTIHVSHMSASVWGDGKNIRIVPEQTYIPDGTAPRITRIARGQYTMEIGSAATAGGIVMAMAATPIYPAPSIQCHPTSKWRSGKVDIGCWRGTARIDVERLKLTGLKVPDTPVLRLPPGSTVPPVRPTPTRPTPKKFNLPNQKGEGTP